MVEPGGPRMGPREWVMLTALALIWGCSYFLNAIALRELPPLLLVWLRVAVAATALLALLPLLGLRLPRERRVWLALLGMGVFNNAVPFSLIVWGQQHIASGLAAILNATAPLFTVIAAHLLTRDERLSAGKVTGVVLGFIGVAIMIGVDALKGLGTDVLAQLACLGAAFCYAMAAVFGRRFKRLGIDPHVAATGQVCASTLVLLPVVLVFAPPWALPVPSWQGVGAVLGLGVFATAIAYQLYFRILATAGATNIQLVTFLVPACAIVLGVVGLNEILLPRHILGLGLIACGLLAIDGRLARLIADRRADAGPPR